eukprot:1196130-Prorocentrum_minimum.AAC.1
MVSWVMYCLRTQLVANALLFTSVLNTYACAWLPPARSGPDFLLRSPGGMLGSTRTCDVRNELTGESNSRVIRWLNLTRS